MKMILFDAMFINSDLQIQEEYDNKTSLQYIFDIAKQQNFDRYVLIQNGCITNVPAQIKNVILNDNRPVSIINTVLDNARNSDEIVFVNAGSPFFDSDFVNQMISRHQQYMADYTYTLGFPDGMTPTIVKRGILPELARLVEQEQEPHKDYLFFALSKDINSFDIETFLSKIDLRLARLTFGQDDFQMSMFTADIFKQIRFLSIDKQVEFLAQNPQKYFCGPYMVGFDLCSDNCISTNFSPDCSNSNAFLDYNIFENVINWKNTKTNYKMTFLFGGLGEPFVHSHIIKMIKQALENGIDVVAETYGCTDEVCQNLEQLVNLDEDEKSRLSIVIKLDSYTKQTYDIIHKGGDFDKANQMFEFLKNAGIKTYKSVVRIEENESEIEQYIRKKQTDCLIIKKHSSYCKTVADKKVVDLSPFERCACFHARREIWIDYNGLVHPCEFNTKTVFGNLHTNTIDEIVQNQQVFFEKNANADYNSNCVECDDYYTFNF